MGCHVAALVISPSTPAGTRPGKLFNHYSLLATAEQLLGLPESLGELRRPPQWSARSTSDLSKSSTTWAQPNGFVSKVWSRSYQEGCARRLAARTRRMVRAGVAAGGRSFQVLRNGIGPRTVWQRAPPTGHSVARSDARRGAGRPTPPATRTLTTLSGRSAFVPLC